MKDKDIVYTDEKGTVRIVDGKTGSSGWYCQCGSGHDYSVMKCSCGVHRKR